MKVTKFDMAVYTIVKVQVLIRPVAGITSWEREGSGDFQHRHFYFFCSEDTTISMQCRFSFNLFP